MKKIPFALFLLLLILGGCSTTKNIPENSYLLNNVKIKTDTKINSSSELITYVRQQPNSSFPLLGKVRLKIYNIAGSDTSKWITRTIRNIGEPPVIYSDRQTSISASQLQKELNNLGYLNAQVDTIQKIKGKKISVTYNLKAGEPYRIRNYTYTIQDTAMARIMKVVPLRPKINRGDLFNQAVLEEERIQVANTIMRNAGYYNFPKEYVYFKADTTLNSHQVDLYLNIYPQKDSLPYTRYKVNKVTIVSGFNVFDSSSNRFLEMLIRPNIIT